MPQTLVRGDARDGVGSVSLRVGFVRVVAALRWQAGLGRLAWLLTRLRAVELTVLPVEPARHTSIVTA